MFITLSTTHTNANDCIMSWAFIEPFGPTCRSGPNYMWRGAIAVLLFLGCNFFVLLGDHHNQTCGNDLVEWEQPFRVPLFLCFSHLFLPKTGLPFQLIP